MDILSSSVTLMFDGVSSLNATFPWFYVCFLSYEGSFLYVVINTMNIVILAPFCVFILHHGVQDWQRRRSSSSAASMSHSDCFTYNMVAMELVGIFGCFLTLYGIYKRDFTVIIFGFRLFSLNYSGQSLFHTLTCVERYLAVMHPVTYLSLKQKKAVKSRNVIIVCVWLLCCGVILPITNDKVRSLISFSLLTSTVLVISFCSLSVLRTLIRPGPGDKKKPDQLKLRAFYTILVILATLKLRLIPGLVASGLNLSEQDRNCATMSFKVWFYLPGSLVLPIMLLHQAGKFNWCLKRVKKMTGTSAGRNTSSRN